MTKIRSVILSGLLFLSLFHLDLSKAWAEPYQGEQLWKNSGYSFVKVAQKSEHGPVLKLEKEKEFFYVKCTLLNHRRAFKKESFELIRKLSEPETAKKASEKHVYPIHETLEDGTDFCQITREATGGSLYDELESKSPTLEWKKKTFKHIVQGVNFLHELGYCHRDIKPENVFLSGEAYLADFDLSIKITEKCESASGTPDYVAPEVLLGKTYDCRKSDAWSLGVVLYVMLTGKYPTEVQDDVVTILDFSKQLIESMKGHFVDGYWAENLVSRLLEIEPNDRMATSAILNHPFLK